MDNSTIYKKSIDRIYNSVVRTHKIQKTYLEQLEFRFNTIQIIKIVATALTAIPTAILGILNYPVATAILAIFTLLSAILGEILDKLEISKNIRKFRDSSNNLWLLRNEIEVFCDEVNGGIVNNQESIKNKLEYFNKVFASYCKDLPTIPDRIVNAASKKLKDREDEKIDFEGVDK